VKSWSRLSVALLLCASSSQAAEIVRLSNEYNLHCIRHEQHGSVTRLYLDENAFIDIPSRQISGYEPDLDQPFPNTLQPIPTESAATSDNPIPRAAIVPTDAATHDKTTIREHIEQAALRTGIDPDFIKSVIRIESGYNAAAVSPKGARGLMQLMPSTAAIFGVRDSLNPAANIEGGSRYLRDLLVRYDGDAIKALAAYNAGPERVERYKGVPPFRETRSYVARVIQDFNRRKLSGLEGAATKKANSSSTQAKAQTARAGESKVSNSRVGE
jgi:Transglycosylase SLT domain